MECHVSFPEIETDSVELFEHRIRLDKPYRSVVGREHACPITQSGGDVTAVFRGWVVMVVNGGGRRQRVSNVLFVFCFVNV